MTGRNSKPMYDLGEGNFSMDVVSVKLNPDFKVFSEDPIQTPDDAADIACRLIGDSDREMIMIFNLMADGKVSTCNIAAVGTLDSCVAHPRELLKSTLLSNATSLLLCHNHPSGTLDPSLHDIELTHRIAKICELLQIRLLDHVIVHGGRYPSHISMLESGILEKKPSGIVDISEQYAQKVAERGTAYEYRNIYREDTPRKIR